MGKKKNSEEATLLLGRKRRGHKVTWPAPGAPEEPVQLRHGERGGTVAQMKVQDQQRGLDQESGFYSSE